MLFYVFLIELENDLGEVETLLVFIADFCYQIFIKEASYEHLNVLKWTFTKKSDCPKRSREGSPFF